MPSLSEIQRLIPIGPLELDASTRRQLNAIVGFSAVFLNLLERYINETSSEEMISKVRRDDDGREEIDRLTHEKRIFRFATEIMEKQDSNDPGVDLLSCEVVEHMSISSAQELVKRAGIPMDLLEGIRVTMGANEIRLPFDIIRISVHSAIHSSIRYLIGQYLYSIYPDARFPIHRVVEYTVEVKDPSQAPAVLVTGYNTSLLVALQGDVPDVVPDTIPDDLFRGDTDA